MAFQHTPCKTSHAHCHKLVVDASLSAVVTPCGEPSGHGCSLCVHAANWLARALDAMVVLTTFVNTTRLRRYDHTQLWKGWCKDHAAWGALTAQHSSFLSPIFTTRAVHSDCKHATATASSVHQVLLVRQEHDNQPQHTSVPLGSLPPVSVVCTNGAFNIKPIQAQNDACFCPYRST